MSASGSSIPASRIVLDTSAYSRLRAGHSTVLDWVSVADVVLMTVTSIGELEAGFLLGSRPDENRRVLNAFLDEPFVETLSVTIDTARTYGRIFAELRRAGAPMPVNDIWIAAQTIEAGAHLVTFDTDFARVHGLQHTVLTGVT